MPLEHWLRGIVQRPAQRACEAEDVFMGYLVHLAGSLKGFDYTLAHMTWTKQVNFNRILGANASGMGWFFPSSETVSVHGLKHGSEEIWELAWSAKQKAGVGGGNCLPIRFRWSPVSHSCQCEDAAVWKSYIGSCGMWGCHLGQRGTNNSRAAPFLKRCAASNRVPLFRNRTKGTYLIH